MRDVEATMPAIASLEDLKIAKRDFRSMFLAASPNDLRLTIYSNILTLCALRFALCRTLATAPEQLKGEGS
jgi:hypothetical protein